jgi:LacI family transcriptional regulator
MLSPQPRPAATRKYYARPHTPSAARAKVQEMAAKMSDGQKRLGHPELSCDATLSVDVIIGVPEGRIISATFPLILRGIHDRAQIEVRERPELESIRIAVRYRPPVDFHPLRPALRIRRLHGTMLVYPFAESAVEVVARGDATVSVLESYSRLRIDSVDTDDEAAVASLVGILHEAGHVRIGFLSWRYPVDGHWTGRRFAGYARGLRSRGLALDPEGVLNGPTDPVRLAPEQVADAAARAVAQKGVTAWVCAADHQAYALIQGLEARGIRVPRDCSVTGFDGLPPPTGLPRATSARVAHEHIGSSALTRMINRILYPSSPPRRILVEAQPVAGDTVATPRPR